MMTRFSAWVSSRWQARRIRCDAVGLATRLKRTEARLVKRKSDLEMLQRRIVSLSEALAEDLEIMTEEVTAVRQELENLGKRQKQYETEMEVLRSRVRVAEDVTIPGLVAANKLVLERYDADTAVQVRRQVLSS